MTLRRIGENSRTRSAMVALFCLAFVFAIGLSASPQLHDWLHKVDARSNHECAATLMSSGSIEHSDCASASVEPQPAPSVPAFRTQQLQRVLASLDFSRLEHAPPALS